MQQLTLQQLFGKNASQTEQHLIIDKSDLPGLTVRSDNTAESLLVAILLQVATNFAGLIVDEDSNALVDEKGESIGYLEIEDYYEALNIFHWKRQFIRLLILDTFVVEIFEVYNEAIS